ncbi:hypothetical protein [uncultured Bacteroides sp.]|uniref:hypothetical protein n=1 Tax=uncultured Bacteroides sp. TaxID=162156 RepID=UPI002623174C|nr:hypothetical protein [uncultured Bacteroides sp.]
MKTRLMTLVVMMAVSISSFSVMAQNAQDVPAQRRVKQKPTPEQMMDRHVKMMEKKLVMDDETAAKFTPLYKEYLQAMKDCRLAECVKAKKAEMTDAEIEQAIQNRFDARQKMLDVQKKYFKKFNELLNAKQLEMVFQQPCMGGKMKPGMQNHKMMRHGDRPGCMERHDCGKCPMQDK